MDFVEYVKKNTEKYLNEMPKSKRKKIGQFFTGMETAKYMASLTETQKEEISVLDPGAGSGILSAAILQNLISSNVKIINLDVYENNSDIISLLQSNLEFMKEELLKQSKILHYYIIEENFITDNYLNWTEAVKDKSYDIAIANPPYLKINKESQEAKAMSEVVYGQPNLYFLFMSMAAKLLKEYGELVFIVPRSFTSGLYFTAFRKWFFKNMKITNLHLFVSRDDVFNCDNVLQETIILKAVKSQESPVFIKITESENSKSFSDISSFNVPYTTCVEDDNNSFLYLSTKEEDIEILDFINQWDYTLPGLGFKLKTGLTVNFRSESWLKFEEEEQTIPLLWAHNIKNNEISFPILEEGKQQYILCNKDTKQLQMNIDNYIIIKRFTSKEEKRRLQCAILNKNQFSKHLKISTENHLNFITKLDGEMTEEEMYGIFAIFNCSYMDKYFRILNGSTQVNANEINSIPVPCYSDIIKIGKDLIVANSLDESTCDDILERKYIKNKMLKAE